MADLALNILIRAQDQASGIIKGLGSSLGGVGSVLLGAGAAIVGIGAASVKMAGDFQAGMTTLVTGAGESASNIKMVSDGILKMAVDTGTSTKQLTDGMFMVESAGYHGAQGLQVLQVAAEGAKVGNADLGVVANAMTTYMQDYHVSAGNAATAMNWLTAVVSNGKTHLQDLAASMSTILPIASAYGIGADQIGGALATMTNAGMTAQHAAQNLAFAIRALETPSSIATKYLKVVGLTAQDLKDTLASKGLPGALQLIEDHIGRKFPAGSVEASTALQKIMGGATGLNVALMLSGKNMSSFQAAITSVGNALVQGGTKVTGWNLVQQTFNFKMDQAKAALETFMIKLGTALLPALTQVVGAIVPVVVQLGDWLTQSGILTGAINLLAGTITVVCTVVSGLITGISTVVGWFQKNQIAADLLLIPLGALAGIFTKLAVDAIVAFIASVPEMVAGFIAGATAAWAMAAGVIAATWPFLAIGAAIAAVVAIVIIVIQHWNAIVQWFSGVWKVTWNAVSSFFVNLWNDLVSFLSGVWDTISSVVVNAATAVAAFFVSIWQGIVRAVQTVWNVIVNVFRIALQVLLTVLFAPFLIIAAIFIALYNNVAPVRNFCNAIVAAFRAAIAWIVSAFQAVSAWLVAAWNFIAGVATTVWNAITNAITTAVKAVVSALTTAWNAVVTFLSGIWKAISTAVMTAWNAVVTFLAGVWKTVSTAIATAWNAVVSYFAGVWKTISGAITTAWNSVVSFLGGIWKTISGALSAAWNGIATFFSNLWNATLAKPLASLGKSLTDFFTGIWNGITGAFKGVVNGIISGINAFIDAMNGIHIHLPAVTILGAQVLPALDIGFPHLGHIPMLAQGGHVMQSGLAIVGENGPELLSLGKGATVIPLRGGGTSHHHHTSGTGTHHHRGASTHHHAGTGTHHHTGTSVHHHHGSSTHHHSGASTHHHHRKSSAGNTATDASGFSGTDLSSGSTTDSSGIAGGAQTVTINITINAAKADAKTVYDLVLKQLTKDLRRSGNLVTMTSGGST